MNAPINPVSVELATFLADVMAREREWERRHIQQHPADWRGFAYGGHTYYRCAASWPDGAPCGRVAWWFPIGGPEQHRRYVNDPEPV